MATRNGVSMSRKAPSKDPRKQYQGAVNRAAGQNFEQTIDDALAYYAWKGEAIIQKTPEPMRVTKRLDGGKFIAYFEKPAQPDYKGVKKGGRAVVFEAKHTTTDRITQSVITQMQSDLLDKYDALGAECFVVVGFSMRDFYRVPWGIFRDMKARWGHKHATQEDLERFRLPTGRNGVVLILED